MALFGDLDSIFNGLDDLACRAAFLSKAIDDFDFSAISMAEQRGMALCVAEIETRIREATSTMAPIVYGSSRGELGAQDASGDHRATVPDLTERAPQPGKRRHVA